MKIKYRFRSRFDATPTVIGNSVGVRTTSLHSHSSSDSGSSIAGICICFSMTTTHSLHHIPHDERPSDRRDATRRTRLSHPLWLMHSKLTYNHLLHLPRASRPRPRAFSRRTRPARVVLILSRPPPRRSIAKSTYPCALCAPCTNTSPRKTSTARPRWRRFRPTARGVAH